MKPAGSLITFVNTNPDKYPTVDRDLLAYHAALCEVCHASGAGELVDSILQDIEEIAVLSRDGNSWELLSSALLVSAH